MKDGHLKTMRYSRSKHGELHRTLVEKWTTPLDLYNSLSQLNKDICNNVNIKCYLNGTESAVTYHDGMTDDGCKYHSKHLHILTVSARHVSESYPYKKLRMALIKKGITLSSQKINKIQNFSEYMTRNPRVYLGSNNADILKLIPPIHDRDDKPQDENPQQTKETTKTKTNKLYEDIQDLLRIMHHFKTSEKDDLYKLSRNTCHADRYRTL